MADLSENALLKCAAALEQNSEHPIAAGILQKKAKELSVEIPSVTDFNAISGKGLEAIVDHKNIKSCKPGLSQ